MSPQVEAAWIALLGVVAGLGGTVAVAIIGFRNTRRATDVTTATALASVREQINADLRARFWERQSAAYTDLIHNLLYRVESRLSLMQQSAIRTDQSRPSFPVDWGELEARLVAYGSTAITDTFRHARLAERRFQSAIGLWNITREIIKESDQAGPSEGSTQVDREHTERQQGELLKTFERANKADKELVEMVRAELHAGTDRPPAPLSP